MDHHELNCRRIHRIVCCFCCLVGVGDGNVMLRFHLNYYWYVFNSKFIRFQFHSIVASCFVTCYQLRAVHTEAPPAMTYYLHWQYQTVVQLHKRRRSNHDPPPVSIWWCIHDLCHSFLLLMMQKLSCRMDDRETNVSRRTFPFHPAKVVVVGVAVNKSNHRLVIESKRRRREFCFKRNGNYSEEMY